MKYEGTAVYTNKAPACAMQGYGAPEVTFGVEMTMNMLAEKLDIDPIENLIGDLFLLHQADDLMIRTRLHYTPIRNQQYIGDGKARKFLLQARQTTDSGIDPSGGPKKG
jgi:hypothetical protein